MGFYIRDDSIRDLAAKLAQVEHCTMTEAIRRALSDRLGKHDDEREARWRKLREIQARLAAVPDLQPGFTDKDLYDENGLPIL